MASYLHKEVSFRGSRNRRRSRSMALTPINSYKQITVDGPASRAAATTIFHRIVRGVDNYSGPSAANDEVPTGAKIFSILVFACFTNLVGISSLLHLNVNMLRAGAPSPTPGVVGGFAGRNTVVMTQMKFLGKDQNSNFMWRIKVPKVFQRIREGDEFFIFYRTDTVFASATQAIYKFYR